MLILRQLCIPQVKLKEQHKMAPIVLRHLKAVGSIILNAKLHAFYCHFSLVFSPTHFVTADVTESREITKWVQAGKYLLVPNETVTLQGHWA